MSEVVDIPFLPAGYHKTDSGAPVVNLPSSNWTYVPSVWDGSILPFGGYKGGYYTKPLVTYLDNATQTTPTQASAPPVAPVVIRLTIASPLTNVPAVPTVSCAVPDSYPILTTLSAPSRVEPIKDFFNTGIAVPLKALEIKFGDNFGDSSTSTRYPIPTTTLLLKIGSGLNSISVYSNRVTYFVGSTSTIKGMTPITKGTCLGVAYSIAATGLATVYIYRNGTLIYTRGGIPTVVSGTVDGNGLSVSYFAMDLGTPPASGYCYTILTGKAYYLDSGSRIVSRPTAINYIYSYGAGCAKYSDVVNIPV